MLVKRKSTEKNGRVREKTEEYGKKLQFDGKNWQFYGGKYIFLTHLQLMYQQKMKTIKGDPPSYLDPSSYGILIQILLLLSGIHTQ